VARAPPEEAAAPGVLGRPAAATGRCGGAPHCAGGSSRTGSDIRGPLGLDAMLDCGATKRSPVTAQAPLRVEPEDQEPWMRELLAAERAGRKARAAVPTRGSALSDGPRAAKEGSWPPGVWARATAPPLVDGLPGPILLLLPSWPGMCEVCGLPEPPKLGLPKVGCVEPASIVLKRDGFFYSVAVSASSLQPRRPLKQRVDLLSYLGAKLHEYHPFVGAGRLASLLCALDVLGPTDGTNLLDLCCG
jgi:hypothetical protein